MPNLLSIFCWDQTICTILWCTVCFKIMHTFDGSTFNRKKTDSIFFVQNIGSILYKLKILGQFFVQNIRSIL